jgi:two-component system NtrC family sensor kinase
LEILVGIKQNFAIARRRTSFNYALLAISVLVPVLLFGIVALLDRGAVLREAEQRVADTTDVFEANALNVFETHELIATTVDAWLGAMSWDEIASSPSVNQYLKQLAARYPQVLGLWLVDPSGKLANSSRDAPNRSVDLSDRDYFIALREKNAGTFVSHVVTGRVAAERNFNIARRRSTTDGAFDGVIVVSVSPEYFTSFWRETAPPLNMIAALLRGDLNILARAPSNPSLNLSPMSRTAQAIQQSNVGSFRTVSAVDGVERLMAFRRVGSYDVYVVHGVAVSAALGLWYRHLAIYGGFFALAAAALFLSSYRALAEANRRRLAEEQLHQAEKMEAIGQLTGQFAHDFGNILTAVLLNLEPARHGQISRANLDEAVNHAINAAEEGQKAVRAMLAFARQEPLESEVLKIDTILSTIEIMVRQALGSESHLVLEIPPETWWVKADPIQLELAVLNLAVNAHDAMPNGGTLRITATNVRLNGEPNNLTGEFVAFSVSDTGFGIPKDLVSRVFDPFFTTKEEGKGTGLGLSQVYKFAKSCGGTATIESERSQGATVTIYLPRAIDAPAAVAAGPPQVAQNTHAVQQQQRASILVVDDEERIRQAVADVLRNRGYAVIEAGTGDEALATLPSHPEIELIFTDIRMPGRRDGISMAAEARRMRPNLKILFATGYQDALRDFESATILRKPFRAHQIVEAVEKELALPELQGVACR